MARNNFLVSVTRLILASFAHANEDDLPTRSGCGQGVETRP